MIGDEIDEFACYDIAEEPYPEHVEGAYGECRRCGAELGWADPD